MPNAELTHHQSMRYSRHVMLPAMDFHGQERLLASRVLVVGVGGLGCARHRQSARRTGNLVRCRTRWLATI